MVKFYCDKCGIECLPTTKVAVQAVMPDGSKRGLHLCKKCWQDTYRFILSEKKQQIPVVESKADVPVRNTEEKNLSIVKDTVESVYIPKDLVCNSNSYIATDDLAKMYEMFEKGVRSVDIAKAFGISSQNVSYRKRKWKETCNKQYHGPLAQLVRATGS